MIKYCILMFLINIDIFFIPLFILFISFFDIKEKEGKNNICDTESFFVFSFLLFIGYIISVSYSLYAIFDRKIEFVYRLRQPLIIVSFIVSFLFFVVTMIYFYRYRKNSYIFINEKRQRRIEEKLILVNKYMKYFYGELSKYNSKSENYISIKKTLKLLEQIKKELEIIYTSLDINIVSESFKNIELESSSIVDIQEEIDKMQAYRSLSEISNELEDLMKKYDKK